MLGIRLLSLIPAIALSLAAQTASTGTIQATGNATISVNPDVAQLTVGVQTQAASAQAAADANAAKTSAVIDALKALLGSTGTLQTVSYSVYPTYSSTGQTITGYNVSNTLQATTADLSLPGRLIDAANQAGATSIGSLSFGLRNPEPVKQQALAQAAKQAQAHATAIAAGLSVKTGALLSAQEAASASPIVAGVAGAANATPVLTGTVNVTATVTITVQLAQ
jgi:uncharacterized protein YggE